MKKKRTVITTEKREVWVIRQPSGDAKELDTANEESEFADSLIRLPDDAEIEGPSDECQP